MAPSMPAIKPKTLKGRIGMALTYLYLRLHYVVLMTYVIGLFLANRIWKIAGREKSKRLRPARDPSRKLKVGIVSEYYYPHLGGLSGDVHYAACVFTKMGYDVKLITSNVDAPHNITQSPHGFEIIRIGRATQIYSNQSYAKIATGWTIGRDIQKLMREQQFDVIHIHCPFFPVLPLLVQLYADCPIIGHIHSTHLEKPLFFKLFHKLIKAAVHDFDGMVAVSKTCARPYEDWFDTTCKIIPNGVPVHEFEPQGIPRLERFDDGKKNIFFIGRLEQRNGVSIAIRAFRIVHQADPNTRLIIAGDGAYRHVFEDEVETELKPHIHFVGAIFEEKPAYFASTDINIVPTNRLASLGITLLESMSSGAPTVCSDIPAFNENVSPGKDVLTAHPDRPEEFAAQILRLIREPVLGEALATRALAKMRERFTWEAIIQRVDNYTNEIFAELYGDTADEAVTNHYGLLRGQASPNDFS